MTRSTRSRTPKSSGVPAPVAPRMPPACESSTITSAPCFSATAHSSSSGAMYPSMENTPSVTTSVRRAPRGRRELRLEVGHVAVLVAEPLRLRQPHAVDDRGVVELVADDRVLGVEQGLEDAAVRVEAGREQDRVFGPEPVGDLALESPVLDVRAADEPDARHPEAVGVERRVRGRDDRRRRRQAEVVVGAQVQDTTVPSIVTRGPCGDCSDRSALNRPAARISSRVVSNSAGSSLW